MGKHAGDRGRARGVRVRPAAWEEFLVHLATKSAIEISKLPGMPSGPAFIKKRKVDPLFAAKAERIMAARRLNNSGRKRISKASIDRFFELLPSMSVEKIACMEGMPSEPWVYQRRARDPAFRERLSSLMYEVRRQKEIRIASALRMSSLWSDPEFVRNQRIARAAWHAAHPPKPKPPKRSALPLGEAHNSTLLKNDLYAAAASVVSERMNAPDRMDIITDLVLAVLEGDVQVSDLAAAAKEYTKRHWKLFGRIGTLSLDAPVSHGSKVTFVDTLANDCMRI